MTNRFRFSPPFSSPSSPPPDPPPSPAAACDTGARMDPAGTAAVDEDGAVLKEEMTVTQALISDTV